MQMIVSLLSILPNHLDLKLTARGQVPYFALHAIIHKQQFIVLSLRQPARSLNLLLWYYGTLLLSLSFSFSLSFMLILRLSHNLEDRSVNWQDLSISYCGTMAFSHSPSLTNSCGYCISGITCKIAQSLIVVLYSPGSTKVR